MEQVRKLYLQTLQEINNDVMNHVHVTRQLAANQIKYLFLLFFFHNLYFRGRNMFLRSYPFE